MFVHFSFCYLGFRVADFFKEMPQFSLKAGHALNGLYGSDWEKRLEVRIKRSNFLFMFRF